MFPAHRTISHLRKEWRTPFRISLQFIVMGVMSVMSGTFPDTYRGFTVTVLNRRNHHRHVIVTVTVIEKTA
jgi:hypothetical protein